MTCVLQLISIILYLL